MHIWGDAYFLAFCVRSQGVTFWAVAELDIKANTVGTSALVSIMVGLSTAALSSASNTHKSNDSSTTQEKVWISHFCGARERRHGLVITREKVEGTLVSSRYTIRNAFEWNSWLSLRTFWKYVRCPYWDVAFYGKVLKWHDHLYLLCCTSWMM